MKRFKYYENFEEEDYDYDYGQFGNKKEDDDTHPWETDYDDVSFTGKRREEEEEEEEIVEDDEDYTVDYVQHLLKEAGLQAYVSTTGKDIEALILLQKQYPFSKFLEIVETLRSISYLEEFRNYTTNFSIFKSNKNQPLIVFDLNYKPYAKTYSNTPLPF